MLLTPLSNQSRAYYRWQRKEWRRTGRRECKIFIKYFKHINGHNRCFQLELSSYIYSAFGGLELLGVTWFSTLKTSKLSTLKQFGNGVTSREEKGFGWQGANFRCLVTKFERKKRRNDGGLTFKNKKLVNLLKYPLLFQKQIMPLKNEI